MRSSYLRSPVSLSFGGCRATLAPDGSMLSFDSRRERRALFGYEGLRIFKLQAGVVVQPQRLDWSLRVSPAGSQFAARLFDSVEVLQSVTFFVAGSGYLRKLRLKSLAQTALKLRVVDLADPTCAKLGGGAYGWGAIGLNAFNRGSHVAMDELADPPAARVVGAVPQPSRYYMTSDKTGALDAASAGELPDSTAGASGQVLILSLHDLELQPGEAKEILFAFLYNPARLEDALRDFGSIQAGETSGPPARAEFACSSQQVSDAFQWALSALDSPEAIDYDLDRYEVGRAVGVVDREAGATLSGSFKRALGREGSVPHSDDRARSGILETSLLLQALCAQVLQAQDRKASRPVYPAIKKAAGFLMAVSKGYSVKCDPSVANGWRRHLGRGYPTGEVPEVTLAVSGALLAASQSARSLGRSDDAGKFRERSEMIADKVKKTLVDERGFLALCLDPSGRLRADECIDMAVAAYRAPAFGAQAAAHRAMEKDFETPFGPRTVPTSNQVYFDASYGHGQLGGFWTRAALAHAVVCYRTGLSGIGSLAVQRTAKLVTEDYLRLGGSPGEFPYWVDVEAGQSHGDGSDPVAASRFAEALLEGEVGLSFGPDGAFFAPPPASGISWALASRLWAGEPVSLFVGRGQGQPAVFLAASKATCKSGTRFAKSDPLPSPARGVTAMTFYGPGQVICLGSSSPTQARVTVRFSPRAQDLTRHLSASLEAFDSAKGSWSRVGSVRVLPAMSFEATLAPGEWKAFRLSTS